MTEELSTDQLAEKVIAFVREKHGGVTFVQLERLLEPHIEIEGHQALMPDGEYPNIIMWGGVSEAFQQVMEAALASGKIVYHPTASLTYMVDGKVPSLPLARSLRQYAEPHWIPLAFYLRDEQPTTGRKKRK
jgi:hypothetical protein